MVQQLIMITLWIIIYGYMITASIEFGTGFYLFYGQLLIKQERLYAPLQNWLSPVSELMNIGFVLIFTAVIGLSPEIVLNFQTPLVFCAVLAILLTVLKGAFFAMAELLPKGKKASKIFFAGNGVLGIFIPTVLSITLVISEGGFSMYGAGGLLPFLTYMFSNLYFWSVMVIAVVSIFYIGAMHLVHFASSIKNWELMNHFRNIALFMSMPTVLASGFVFLGIELQNPDHFLRMLGDSWLFMLSLICLLVSVTLVFLRKYRFVFILVMLQYFFAFFGYTVTHLPFLIYPDIVIDSRLASWGQSGWFFLITLITAPALLSVFLLMRRRGVLRNAALQQSD
jgi:cytochrome d ubiquinol oxidase subunit II